ncbi:AraC family ligand binding domain-containing protein [Pedobacter sp. PLR]|uniref:AraC family transcriptional regulator n=1 Tax=Pedobacter sp. PLR TaxID=2994465 RepID=UPI002247132F|nr:AraC family ligand binding domain-containing protein [Pedobacter sp. PLR]MCX2454193.1 AraC family ligand binding domain-containing protein [Pedobacter sp. PLR]
MMKRYKQFEPVLISDFEVLEWQHPVHSHNHYELIYISHGSGRHFINSVPVDYRKGDVFLLGPEEEHYFEVIEKTRFIYLKFTDAYIHQRSAVTNSTVKHLEYLIKSRETHHSGFNLSAGDQTIVDLLFGVIIAVKHDLMRNEQVIWMQVLALSEILQRNMPEIKASANRSRDMQAVFCYIHKHIYSPANLKADVMAGHFHFTSGYIGPYFKRNTGITLRKYIGDYRSSLIRQRLDSGRFTLKQLAAEFGLTDESHVSKLLKSN